MEGFRVARPGEFTRRAFENGRIDLTQAEGLADLIEAETESQRKTALAVAEGGLRREVEEWQYRVVQLSARAEAAIDYADQDGADRDLGLSSDCDALASEIAEWLERPRTEPLKDGVRVVIAGPPNSGKSSLINAIAGQERAIVTDLPGTTRDHIDVPIALEGIPVLLTDTAGLRETEEVVERLGVERAKLLMDAADVLVWLGESTDLPGHSNALQVYPRADLPDRRDVPAGSLAVSSRTGEGLGALLARVGEMARSFLPVEGAISLNRRQATEIAEAHAGLAAAAAAPDLVIAAENLRAARSAFDRLTGRAGIEDVIDALFGRFCLGK
jgi:tRNA modification GTPase